MLRSGLLISFILSGLIIISCNQKNDILEPLFITEKVPFDSDDPAI